ncbi:hypothetical protein [Bacteroides sp. 519]|uniref:hypothetical protein n=1 Tax=Bacteroides sp. 519 TaxID=2302937 RepID=UPI0013D1AF00|nr:hypothetical protein [Bacteroides sp. 519]NDV56895.1 hypothetical protein [Bacteroides sp. 519]
MRERNLYLYLLCTLLFVLASCGTNNTRKRHLTERLFLERSRITITHPGVRPGQGTGSQGPMVLNEQVNYSEQPQLANINDNNPDESRLDTNKVYTLSQVTVTSRARFAPVREGQVNIDFIIHVPEAYLSDDFQLTITPELITPDSVVNLDDVVLRGKNFIELQKKDYERFQQYLDGIIDPSAYDSAFVNHRGVNRELGKRRQTELDSYYNKWALMQEYRDWRNTQQAKYDAYNVKHSEELRQKLIKHEQKYRPQFNRRLAMRADTTELGRKYRAERKKIIASSPVKRQITLDAIPVQYREFYFKNITPEDLGPLLPRDKDSIALANEYLLHDKIAANEARGSRQQEVFKYMVPAPYRPDAHYSTTIVPGKNYSYRYTRTYPVTAGMKNLKLTLGGNITAVDRSYYKIQYIDTLSYVISSMDELADGSLLGNPAFTADQRTEYMHALKLLRNREYQRALNILSDYDDYNTAVALTCLGYNGRAYNMLATLPQTANTHYLAAILCSRLKEMQAAVDHLMEACRLDPGKINRAQRDPEISKMIQDYNLQEHLNAIEN